MKRISLLAPLFAVSLFSVTATAELITNGSFENSAVSTTTTLVTANVTDWTDPLGAGEALVFPSWHTSGFLFPGVGLAGPWPASSPDGGNFIFSDADFSTGSISQTVGGLTLGHTYDLSFYQGLAQDTEPNVTVPGPVTAHWHVTFGTAPAQNSSGMSADGSIPTMDLWAQENMSFVASATSEVLTFMAVGVGDPPIAMLDGVHMSDAADNPDGTAPEPAGIWLTGLGGALLAWKAMTRRRA